MSQDDANIRRCGQIGEGEDDQVSMVDVLNEQTRLQADADAVLGGSDEYNCTYPRGYVNRQALYACATCTPEGNAGICLACSYACHEGHDIHELYTKRSFKCDCGNEKFKGNSCQLYKEKKDLNSRNRYDQNFRGLYCTCSRPYPDEDDPVEDEMIQCIMCEDWYHGRHLKTEVPDNSDFHEMICSGCMCKFSFLWAYHVKCAVTSVGRSDEEAEEMVAVTPSTAKCEKSEDACTPSNRSVNSGNAQDKDSISPKINGNTEASSSSLPVLRKAESEAEEAPPAKRTKTSHGSHESQQKIKQEEVGEIKDGDCLLRSLQQRVVEEPDHAAFWAEGWRSKLCRCSNCLEMYHDRNIEFLIDEADTMQAYEERGAEATRSAAASDEANGAEFASMNRVQQIEVVRGVMDFKSQLNAFLEDFAREGKVVKESDIREFFQRLTEKRRQGIQLPQPNCR